MSFILYFLVLFHPSQYMHDCKSVCVLQHVCMEYYNYNDGVIKLCLCMEGLLRRLHA